MTIEEQLVGAYREVRRRNARRINLLRAVGAGAFTASIAITICGLHNDTWRPLLIPTALYLAIAVALFVGGRSNPRILWISRFAIPVFDMPVIFAIQWQNLIGSEAPGHVSEFSVALFVCLLLLSAFTLNRGQIFISLALAIVFEQILQNAAGMAIGPRINSVTIFVIATWICIVGGRSRLRLVETLTETNARRMLLRRYFSPGIAKLLEEQEEDVLARGQERELTVMFADIRGFTALTEGLVGREVIQLLNSFHTGMVDAVFRCGGTLDKYLGDGLMVYFNAPIDQPDHADRAIRCAMAMKHELTSLNSSHSFDENLPLQMGIGIHTGRAIVGDIGAPHRREFTAIGLAVNVAARLEEMTKDLGIGILVSEATAKLVGNDVSWSNVGEFPVRGCSVPLHLLTPLAAA